MAYDHQIKSELIQPGQPQKEVISKKPFCCHLCYKGYTQPRRLKEHFLTHMLAGEMPKNLDHFCKKCGKAFSNAAQLKEHLKTHTATKKRPYMCPAENCGKSFLRRSLLNIHMTRHTGEKPFKCTECGKRFSRR